MAYARKITSLVQSGRSREALPLCEQYCREQPNQAEAWFLRAGVQAQLGALDEVVACCRKAVELAPGHIGAWYNLGVALQSLHLWEAAVDAYTCAIRLNPAFVSPYSNIISVLRQLGRLSEALQYAREAVRLDPRQSINVNNLGLVLLDNSEFDEALKQFDKSIKLDPAAPDPLLNKGLALVKASRPQEAIEWIERALSIRADYADAYNALAGARHALGDTTGAVSAFERAIELDPRCAQAHNNLGLLSQQGDDPTQAEQRFRAALAIDSRSADFENNLGTVLMTQGRFSEAIQTFRSATLHDDRHAAAWNNLGNALLSVEAFRENFPEAEAAYRRAIEIKPDFAEAWYHYGTCLQQQGNYEEACGRYGEAAKFRPDYIEALAGQVMVLERIGRFPEASAILQPLLSAHKDNVLVALACGVMARHLEQREQALELLETLDPQGLEQWARIQRNFVMGDLYDDMGEHGKAFGHYHAANTEDHPGYSIKLTEHLFASLKGVYSSDKQASRPHASNRSELPVFIVGMPRSGTSLLEQILASHPDVHGAGELLDMYHLTGALPKLINSKWPYPACMDDATTETLDRIADEYLVHLQSYAPGAKRIVDKMPHNFEALGLIERLFPGARVLHCRRNPIDTCVSIYFKQFNSLHPYASDLRSLGLYYRQYEQLMDYWKRTLTLPILDVQYEEMVANQEDMSRRILAFVGLEWDERCLNYHQLERTVNTPSYDQVRKPIYTRSVERWRRYEKDLGPLLDALEL